MPTPWFALAWRRAPGGGRARVAAVLYLVAGLAAAATAAVTSRGVMAMAGWLFVAAVLLALGITLTATLLWRRKNG